MKINISKADILNLRSDIREKKININHGDYVVLFRKKSNGYPNQIDLYEKLKVIYINGDNCVIINNDNKEYSINKTFLIEFKMFLKLKRLKIINKLKEYNK